MDNKDVKHILIVDDEPDIITILKVILNRTNRYRVSSAEDGKKALDFLSTDTSVDLVLADMKMPEIDGAGLIKKIKEQNFEKPKFMFITGFTDLFLDELYNAGACGFVFKPFDWEKIISAIDEALLPKPKYQKAFKQQDVKTKIALELESIDIANLYSEDFALGSDGLFVLSPKEAFVGDLVSFEISFVGGEIKKIEGVGQVAWYKGLSNGMNQLGLRFYNISAELELKIEKFCKKNNVKAFIPRR